MFKFFTSDFRRNIIKVFCLAMGMAIGMLLVAKVYFEQTIDAFIDGSERIYMLMESIEMNGEYMEYDQTAGAIAPGVKRYAPMVESATRRTMVFGEMTVLTPDGRSFTVPDLEMADSSFFTVIPRPIVAGNAAEALEVAWSCMIPRSLAEKIGGDVVGMRLVSPDFGMDRSVVVGGVYEDFNTNSTFENGIYMSLSTLPYISYDGRENWIGNDRYRSYARLMPGAKPEEVKPYIRRMLEENIDKEDLERSNYDIPIKPLLGYYTSMPGVQTMNWVIGILALIILASSALNYLLIVLAQMQWRAKEMAVRKCYGTSRRHIFGMVVGESLVFMLISLGMAAVIVASLAAECEQLLGAAASDMLANSKFWLIGLGICLLLLFITGVVPAWMYCHTPVTQAFRRHTGSRRTWKLAMLAVQFFASAFLFCLLVVVGRQYAHLNTTDIGYDYKNLATASLHRIDPSQRGKLVEELRHLSCVAGVSTAYQDYTGRASGNNVWTDDYEKQVNIADCYEVNPDIFEVMGMEFVQGRPFDAVTDTVSRKIVVDERFIETYHKISGEEDNDIVGKTVKITEHSDNGTVEFEIVGVVRELKRNGFNLDYADMRAAVIFPSSFNLVNLYVRFHDMNEASLAEVRSVIDSMFPGGDVTLVTVKSKIDAANQPIRRFGSSVMIAGIVIILITLIGLVGYAADEVRSRAKEIAVRKVNGMSVASILRMLCADVAKVAVPSLLVGGVGAYIVGKEWVSQFTEQAGMNLVPLLLTLVAILVVLMLVVIGASLSVARTNPIVYLRNE